VPDPDKLLEEQDDRDPILKIVVPRFIRGRVKVKDRFVGSSFGSDHFPTITDFYLE
jgi:hypothetical protein